VPYLLDVARAASDRRYRTVVLICASQMGKTEWLFNEIGRQFTDRPRPCLYVGPTEKNVRSMSLDRVAKMIRSTPPLREALLGGIHDKVTEKWIGGARLGFAWASSATELASHPAHLAIIDERDRMASDIGGEGDPVTLVRARLKNYFGSTLIVTSTPTIEHLSPIWDLWLEGTMGVWSWLCPACDGWFAPRSELLRLDEEAPLSVIEREAYLECPHCQHAVRESDKRGLEARYVFHAERGDDPSRPAGPTLEPPENSTASFLVNGLASQFPGGRVGTLARNLVAARRTRDPTRVQACLNTDFGELYRAAGERPSWQEVEATRGTYRRGEIPHGAQALVLACDVQRDRLYWLVRGFGHQLESWLIDHGVIFGATDYDDAWISLGHLIGRAYGHLTVARALVDSGYKPGSEYRRPENVIYAFCRRFSPVAMPSKGYASSRAPVNLTPLKTEGVNLVGFDTDHFKTSLHIRIRWPQLEPGAWHTHADIDEDYCRQVVAEEVVTTPGGKRVWVDHNRPNHYGDCEVLALVAARTLTLEALPPIEHVQAAQAAQARQAEARGREPPRGGRFERFS
jgi:phage terminase large subunit GpA-like protein